MENLLGILAAAVSIHAPARGATAMRGIGAFQQYEFRSTPPRGGRPWLDAVLQRDADQFRSTPPRGGRLPGLRSASGARRFRSTPPRGGRPPNTVRARRSAMFRSTPPRGGRPHSPRPMFALIPFRSTPPRGGRPPALALFADWRGFDPRPREGGDDQDLVPLDPAHDVSIHAPARGATAGAALSTVCIGCFDPRPREGGDADVTRTINMMREVSIHAPARGATVRYVIEDGNNWVSIHAPARGATILRNLTHVTAQVFRSTPPRGGRLVRYVIEDGNNWVSIHAPARGATAPALSKMS